MPSVEITQSVSDTNFKAIAEAQAVAVADGFKLHQAHTNRMNILAESAVGKMIKVIHEPDVAEAVASQKMLSGNDLVQQLLQGLITLAGGQIGNKAGNTTPPQTGNGG